MDNSFFLLLIIGLTALISFKGFNDIAFFRKYEFHVGSIRAGEQIRMFSSGFLHADISHLAFNMISLYFFAPIVYNYFGSWTFLTFYFGSLLFGSMLTLLFHKNDYNYRAIGASGAVTGIIYAAILLNPYMSIYMFFIPIPIPAYLFGIGYLFYSIYGMKSKNDTIGHTAHFGGAIGGYVLTLLKNPALITHNIWIVLLLALPILILFILTKQGKL